MNINVISLNQNLYTRKNYSSKLNFKGAISNDQLDKSLNMLKDKVESVQVCSNMDEVVAIVKSYIRSNDGTVGTLTIPSEKLGEFLGDKAKKINLKDKAAICVAVGDKYGPIEDWSQAYRATVALVPKNVLK